MVSYPSIIEKFYEYEKKQPEKLFLAEPFEGIMQRHSWHSVGQAIRQLAAALMDMQLPSGSRIAIIGKNSPHWIMADLAIMMAGHVSVPIYPTVTANTLEQILIHSESKLIFVGKLDAYEPIRGGIPDTVRQVSFPNWPWPGCCPWIDFVGNSRPLLEDRIPDSAAMNCILYTSGTTGNPKGVMHTHYAHAYSLLTVMEALGETLHNEVFFSYLPLSHIAERMVVEYCGIFTGGTIYFPESLQTFSKDLQAAQPTIFLAVPRIWEKFREEILKKIPPARLSFLLGLPLFGSLLRNVLKKKLGLSRVRFALSGASPLHPSLPVFFGQLGITIQEAYGMTENMALATINRKHSVRIGTVGQSYTGVELVIGAQNEILTKSPATMLGYYKEPELSAACFENGFLKTGDEGRLDADGYLTITGRIKDLFKTSKGKYVAPAPIEKLLMEHTLFAQVCVVGSGQSGALALCVLTIGEPTDRSELNARLSAIRSRVNQQLELHEQLVKLVMVAEEWTIANGFITPTLKIRRSVMDTHYESRYEQWLRSPDPIVWA
jgi:long-chain acyl-CoA synthetase